MGWVLATTSGKIILRRNATVKAVFASTMLLELTTLVHAINDISENLLSTERRHCKLWVCCDNKAAAKILKKRDIMRHDHGFLGVVLAKALWHKCNFEVGWCPAQNDTQKCGMLSQLNGITDNHLYKSTD